MNSPARILVLEDEALVADDLAQILEGLGYEVVGLASTGAQAMELAQRQRPDLILSDIQLQGAPDGVETTSAIRRELDVPVVFVTAHAGSGTLRRAQSASPFGYVIKPFTETDLRVSIEIALQRHNSERSLRDAERFLAATLRCITDGVIAIDMTGRVTFMNPVAEKLTGSAQVGSVGRELSDIFHLIDSVDLRPISSAVVEAMKTGRAVSEVREATLIGLGARRISVDYSCAPIRGEAGDVVGGIIVFREVTSNGQRESESSTLIAQLHAALANVKTLSGLLPICSWCRKIRDDSGNWQELEAYICAHSNAEFTHGVCPDCETNQLEQLDKL